MTEQPFLTDIKTLRERARRHSEQGAVTAGYKAEGRPRRRTEAPQRRWTRVRHRMLASASPTATRNPAGG